MTQRLYSMSLKMLYISLLPKYIKQISESCKNPLTFIYISVPGSNFVYGGCTGRNFFTRVSLCDNLHSTFY